MPNQNYEREARQIDQHGPVHPWDRVVKRVDEERDLRAAQIVRHWTWAVHRVAAVPWDHWDEAARSWARFETRAERPPENRAVEAGPKGDKGRALHPCPVARGH